MTTKKVLIDGDVLAYRAAFSTQNLGSDAAIYKIEELISYVLEDTLTLPYFPSKDNTSQYFQVYLTGKGNFRFSVSEIYKANRAGGERPKHIDLIRQYMIDNWGAIVSLGEEADDLIAIEATRLGKENVIVASIDKDMLQIPGYHFNITKGTTVFVDDFEGTKFFYTQILTGDKVDNVIGLKGVGPVTAKNILMYCNTEEELWNAVVEAYDGDTERIICNARLLWLRRKEEELWEPPKVT